MFGYGGYYGGYYGYLSSFYRDYYVYLDHYQNFRRCR
jgi:hypothetical protein